MRFFFSSKSLLIIAAFCFSTQFASAQSTEPAIATLLQVEGAVEAVTAKSPKGRRGKNGMLLFAGNKISTAEIPKQPLNIVTAQECACFRILNWYSIYPKNRLPVNALSNFSSH